MHLCMYSLMLGFTQIRVQRPMGGICLFPKMMGHDLGFGRTRTAAFKSVIEAHHAADETSP